MQGYVLIEGERGSGKTLLCRSLTPLVRTSRLGELPALYLPIRARLQNDCQTFIEQLNEHLRIRPRPGRRSFAALDHHVIKHLNVRFPAQARAARFAAYLSELYLINETPFLLILDGLDETFEGLGGQASLMDFLPAELPDGVFILATYRPTGLSARGQSRVDQLRQRSSMVIQLDPETEDYRLALEQHFRTSAPLEGWSEEQFRELTDKSAGMIGMARHQTDLLRSGLLAEGEQLPQADEYYEFTLATLESRFEKRFLQFFLLLATSDEPIQASEFSSFGIGRDDALELVYNLPSFFYCFDLENPGISLAHGALKHHLQETYFTLYAEVCEQLSRVTLRRLTELEHPVNQAQIRRDQLSLALRRLFNWSLDSQSSELLAEVAGSEKLRAVRTAVFAQLEESGLFHRKITILDAFRQILAALVERFGQDEYREELAWAHSSRGLAYLHLGHFERALGDIERAIHHFTHLVENEGQVDLRNGLAAAYNRRSEVCRSLHQWGPALSDANSAVEQYRVVVEEQKRDELRALLALAIHNRGQVYRARGEFKEALADFDNSVSIYSELVDIHRQRRLRKELAQAHHSRCCLLLDLNRGDEALIEAEAAIELMEQLVHDEDYESLRNDLASVYNDRAAIHHRAHRYERADQDYASAVNIRNYLVTEGRLDVRTDLARTYTNRGLAMVARSENSRALDCYARAVELLDRLIDTEMREDLYAARAFAHVCRARLLELLDNSDEAHNDFEAAAGDYRLAVVSGDEQALPELAGALNHHAASSLSRGELSDALRSSARAIEIYESDLEGEQAKRYTHERAVAHRNRAQALYENGQTTQAFEEFDSSIELYTELLENEGRADLAADLAVLHLRRGETALELRNAQSSVRDSSRALALFSNLTPADGQESSVLRGQAEAKALRGSAYEILGSPDAALDDSSASLEMFRQLVDQEPCAVDSDILAELAERRGRLLLGLGDYAQACIDFAFALAMLERLKSELSSDEFANRKSEILLSRAEALLESGQASPAVRDLVEAYASGRIRSNQTKMATVDKGIKALKVQALALLQEREFDTAIEAFNHLVELLAALGVQQHAHYQEQLAQALSQRGWAKSQLSRLEEALDDFDETLEILDSLDSEAHLSLMGKTALNRAATLDSMGFTEAAAEGYQNAVEILEGCPGEEGHLAGALSHRANLTEDPESAYQDLERAIELLTKSGSTESLGELKKRQVELLLARPENGKIGLVERAIDAYRGLDDPVRGEELLELLSQKFAALAPDHPGTLEGLTSLLELMRERIELGDTPSNRAVTNFLAQVGRHFKADSLPLEKLLDAAEGLCVQLLRKELGSRGAPDLLLDWTRRLPDDQQFRRGHFLVLASGFCGAEVKDFGASAIPRLVRCLLWSAKAMGESASAPPYLEVLVPVFEQLISRIEMTQIDPKTELELNNTARLWLSLPASLLAKSGLSRTTLERLRRW